MKQGPSISSQLPENTRNSLRRYHFSLSVLFACLMGLAFTLLIAVLPLYSLFFFPAFPKTALQAWLLNIAALLIPKQAMISAVQTPSVAPTLPFAGSWLETIVLALTFALLLLVYILAMRFVSASVSPRFIFISTLMFGTLCVFSPALTSQDLYSYALYARIGVIYHLNPLTTLPIAVPKDPLYPYIFWIRQPSAYGPSWVIVTSLLQLLMLPLGTMNTLPLLLSLRLFGLLMHLGSVILLWSIINTYKSGLPQSTKVMALLLFAWNPLLLVEACINAHNDTTILFLLLLVVWLLAQPRQEGTSSTQRYLFAAIVFAIAAGLKITYGLLMPGLLLFIWAQEMPITIRMRQLIWVILGFVGILVVLYAPFWQQGTVLRVLQVNPGITRDINSLYQLLIAIGYAIKGQDVPFFSNDMGTPVEILSHTIALLCFILLYGALSLWYITHPHRMRQLPAFIYWMALSWLLYCLVGSPWFWPWYIGPFLGLGALIVGLEGDNVTFFTWLHLRPTILWLTFSMLSMYCLFTWAPHRSTLPFTPIKWGSITGLAWVFLLFACNTSVTIHRGPDEEGPEIHATIVDDNMDN